MQRNLELGTRNFQVPFAGLDRVPWNEFLFALGTWNLELGPFGEELAGVNMDITQYRDYRRGNLRVIFYCKECTESAGQDYTGKVSILKAEACFRYFS